MINNDKIQIFSKCDRNVIDSYTTFKNCYGYDYDKSLPTFKM